MTVSRVIRLQAQNIKGLVAVDITPDPHMVVVTGPNGAGKSSVLDCLVMGLKGGRDIPEEPIRSGEDKGGIQLDLDDYVVVRNFTKKGNYLKVYAKDRTSINSPQALLDTIVGAVSFDPLEFSRGESKWQRQMLLDLAGVDTSQLDNQYANLYEERTLVGREVKRLQGVLSGLPYDDTASKEEVSVTTLSEKLQKAMGYNAKLQAYQKEVNNLVEEMDGIERQIHELENRLMETRVRLAEKRAKIQGRELIDTNPIVQSIKQAEETNKRVAVNKKYTEVLALLGEADNEHHALTEKLEGITLEKQSLLSETKMPIRGLAVTDDSVLYNGIPLKQASDGEKLMIGVAVAMALNPEVRVIRITDGSLIDSTNFKRLEKLTKDKDFQVWVEVVEEKKPIYMLDDIGNYFTDEDGNPIQAADAAGNLLWNYPTGLYIEEGVVAAIDGLVAGE